MEITIHRGDCRQLLKQLETESVDAFVSDPPYGIELNLGTSRQPRRILGDGRDEAKRLWRGFLPEAYRAAKPNTAHAFFGTWKSIWIRDLLAEHFAVKGCVVWYKNTWGLGYYLRPRWELLWLCHKGKPPRPWKAMPDVWQHARDHRLMHPCQKPVDLLRQAIRLVVPPEHRQGRPLICDPFAGIFSTAVAAVEEDCRFVGFERDARYVKMGQARVARALREAAAS